MFVKRLNVQSVGLQRDVMTGRQNENVICRPCRISLKGVTDTPSGKIDSSVGENRSAQSSMVRKGPLCDGRVVSELVKVTIKKFGVVTVPTAGKDSSVD